MERWTRMPKAFLVRSTDADIVRRCQSGGFITVALRHLLTTGVVDHAVVAHMDGMVPRAVTIGPDDDPIDYAGSVYAPVPIVAELRKLPPGSRVAVTALPCQLRAIHRLMARKRPMPDILTIGPFCDRMMTRGFIEFASRVVGAKEPIGFSYRSKERGFPGDVRVDLQDRHLLIPGHLRVRYKPWFAHPACHWCPDKLNGLADIAVGDGWRIDGENHEASAVLPRAPWAVRMVEDLLESGAIEGRAIDPVQVSKAQRANAKFQNAMRGPSMKDRLRMKIARTTLGSRSLAMWVRIRHRGDLK